MNPLPNNQIVYSKVFLLNKTSLHIKPVLAVSRKVQIKFYLLAFKFLQRILSNHIQTLRKRMKIWVEEAVPFSNTHLTRLINTSFLQIKGTRIQKLLIIIWVKRITLQIIMSTRITIAAYPTNLQVIIIITIAVLLVQQTITIRFTITIWVLIRITTEIKSQTILEITVSMDKISLLSSLNPMAIN